MVVVEVVVVLDGGAVDFFFCFSFCSRLLRSESSICFLCCSYLIWRSRRTFWSCHQTYFFEHGSRLTGTANTKHETHTKADEHLNISSKFTVVPHAPHCLKSVRLAQLANVLTCTGLCLAKRTCSTLWKRCHRAAP